MNKCLALIFGIVASSALANPKITIGSKPFTEGYVLAELIAQIVETTPSAEVERKLGLGETGIVFQALKTGEIDFYPEYTGTISDTLLKNPDLRSVEEIRSALRPLGLTISSSLGFSNTYALATTREFAQKRGIKNISDLKQHKDIRAGFSSPFINREDCLPKIQQYYKLNLASMTSLTHGLIYEAIINRKIDLIDIYSTDAKLKKFDLVTLKDDLRVFPQYEAVIMAKLETVEKYPEIWSALTRYEGKISEQEMIRLNSLVELDGKSFDQAAANFLGIKPKASKKQISQFWKWTVEHSILVLISVLVAVVIGVPAAIVASRYNSLGQGILIGTGLVQTIPSLALLCFLIPLFGIGKIPALVALILYALLPIVRSTYVGLIDIDPKLKEVSVAQGLTQWQRLRLIELPLASRSIMGGIKTSAIITVGTATLAALIGAGGYGDPIVTGLALNNPSIILKGAIPAAVFALLVHGIFEGLDKMLVPRGLR